MKNSLKITPGKWVYSPNRHTHDSIIHSENAIEEYGQITNGNGGVIGSSEWIWIKEEDALFIADAGTVANETGYTPRQLAEQKAGLLEALQEFMRGSWIDENGKVTINTQSHIYARELGEKAIKNATP